MDLNQKIVTSLERISQAFRVLLWSECRKHGLSPIQIQILIFLLNHSKEKRKISYLAVEFDMTKATISDSVKVLFQKSLVEKEFETNDSRSYTIHLTPEGEKTAKQTSSFVEELEKAIDKMSGGEKENLLLNLLGIIESLNHSGVISIQRMCFSCSNYSPGYNANPHFCKLLNKPLKDFELQVDCPEFEMK